MMSKIVTCASWAMNQRCYSTGINKIKAQKYVLIKYFQGEPKKSDFKIVEENLPELKEGGKYIIDIMVKT